MNSKHNKWIIENAKRVSFLCAGILLVTSIILSGCSKSSSSYTPSEPSGPTPGNGAKNIAVNTSSISWATSSDPNGSSITYDVYFGTSSSPSIRVSNTSSTSYSISGLTFNTTYYWKVVAKNSSGYSSTGPLWSFTTDNGTGNGN
ncbi:MAG: fibronectin type III domain-containing protein [Bacteroidota bacterium]|nr:fibronectin type III domain-containing protein [Bacteroidota bacterium]